MLGFNKNLYLILKLFLKLDLFDYELLKNVNLILLFKFKIILNGIIFLKIYFFFDLKFEIGNLNLDNLKVLFKYVLKKMGSKISFEYNLYYSYLWFCRYVIGVFVSEDIKFVLI